MRTETLDMFDRLSLGEIVILLGQDPCWVLPRGSVRWRSRMDAAFAAIEAERLGRRPKGERIRVNLAAGESVAMTKQTGRTAA